MKTVFLVKSSSGKETYKVDFIDEDGRLKVKCDCPAGRFGKFCKHKLSLLQGYADMLYNETQEEELYKISERVQKSDYLWLIIELSKAKSAVSKAEANVIKVHKKFAKAMKEGVNKIE